MAADDSHRYEPSDVRAAWDANAAFWDERMGEGNDFVEQLCWPAITRLLALQRGERVLDVACGNGLTSRRLATGGAEVVAVDFSPAMIERARARTSDGARVDYHVLDATDEVALLALGEGRFDAAISNMALMDMSEVAPLFRALARLLRAEGRFVFSVMHPAFNSVHTALVTEDGEHEGRFVTDRSVRVKAYLKESIARGEAIGGQPQPHLYFHRPLSALLAPAFEAGLVLDGLEEPAFPPPDGSSRGFWDNTPEIPPVLVLRLRLPG